MPVAFCPHCLLVLASDVPEPFPPQPTRCPHCRLAVAPGRARFDVEHAAGSSGSAAGVLASAARREHGDAVTAEEVADALRRAAQDVGVSVARLRMLDYQRVSAGDDSLPGLGSVIDCCGSWKRARLLAS